MIDLFFFYLLSIDVSVWQNQWRVVFIHWLTRESTDEVGLGVVSKWERLAKLIKVLRTNRTLHIEFLRLVTLTGGLDLRTINETHISKKKKHCLLGPKSLLQEIWQFGTCIK